MSFFFHYSRDTVSLTIVLIVAIVILPSPDHYVDIYKVIILAYDI